MISLPVDWKVIVVGLAVVAIGGYIWHCESSKTELAQVAAVGRAANEENAKRALRDQTAKERSDEEHDRRLARLRADVQRLRNTRASALPTATALTGSAVDACYSRSELDAALRSYRERVAESRGRLRELAAECGASIEGLEAAKNWAQRPAQ